MKNRSRDRQPDKHAVTKTDQILSRLKNKPALAVLLVIVIALIGTSDVFDAIQKISEKYKRLFGSDLHIVHLQAINSREDLHNFLSKVRKSDIESWNHSWGLEENQVPRSPTVPLIDITFLNSSSDPSVVTTVELSLERRVYRSEARPRGGFILCMADLSGIYNVVVNPLLERQTINVNLAEMIPTKGISRFIIILGSTIDINNIERRRMVLHLLRHESNSDLLKRFDEAGLLDYIKYHAEFDVVLNFTDHQGRRFSSAPVKVEFNDKPCQSQMSKRPFAYSE